MDGELLRQAIAAAAPALSIDNEAHGLRFAIRLHCGSEAGALEARLTQLVHDAEMVALGRQDALLARVASAME